MKLDKLNTYSYEFMGSEYNIPRHFDTIQELKEYLLEIVKDLEWIDENHKLTDVVWHDHKLSFLLAEGILMDAKEEKEWLNITR